jgi:hypothetical protein
MSRTDRDHWHWLSIAGRCEEHRRSLEAADCGHRRRCRSPRRALVLAGDISPGPRQAGAHEHALGRFSATASPISSILSGRVSRSIPRARPRSSPPIWAAAASGTEKASWRSSAAFRFLVAPPDLTEDSDADRGCAWAGARHAYRAKSGGGRLVSPRLPRRRQPIARLH